jgi:hypothetical protein
MSSFRNEINAQGGPTESSTQMLMSVPNPKRGVPGSLINMLDEESLSPFLIDEDFLQDSTSQHQAHDPSVNAILEAFGRSHSKSPVPTTGSNNINSLVATNLDKSPSKTFISPICRPSSTPIYSTVRAPTEPSYFSNMDDMLSKPQPQQSILATSVPVEDYGAELLRSWEQQGSSKLTNAAEGVAPPGVGNSNCFDASTGSGTKLFGTDSNNIILSTGTNHSLKSSISGGGNNSSLLSGPFNSLHHSPPPPPPPQSLNTHLAGSTGLPSSQYFSHVAVDTHGGGGGGGGGLHMLGHQLRSSLYGGGASSAPPLLRYTQTQHQYEHQQQRQQHTADINESISITGAAAGFSTQLSPIAAAYAYPYSNSHSNSAISGSHNGSGSGSSGTGGPMKHSSSAHSLHSSHSNHSSPNPNHGQQLQHSSYPHQHQQHQNHHHHQHQQQYQQARTAMSSSPGVACQAHQGSGGGGSSVEEAVLLSCREILLGAADHSLKAVELANTLRARGMHACMYV